MRIWCFQTAAGEALWSRLRQVLADQIRATWEKGSRWNTFFGASLFVTLGSRSGTVIVSTHVPEKACEGPSAVKTSRSEARRTVECGFLEHGKEGFPSQMKNLFCFQLPTLDKAVRLRQQQPIGFVQGKRLWGGRTGRRKRSKCWLDVDP
jgi:hypothetical protein